MKLNNSYIISYPTYEIKDKLKSIGCQYDWEEKVWWTPDEKVFKKAIMIQDEYRRVWQRPTNVFIPEPLKENMEPKNLLRPVAQARCFRKGFNNSDNAGIGWMKRKTNAKY